MCVWERAFKWLSPTNIGNKTEQRNLSRPAFACVYMGIGVKYWLIWSTLCKCGRVVYFVQSFNFSFRKEFLYSIRVRGTNTQKFMRWNHNIPYFNRNKHNGCVQNVNRRCCFFRLNKIKHVSPLFWNFNIAKSWINLSYHINSVH